MITGLIIGKFIPPHAGHFDLIRFGSERCDRLIVGISSTPEDPIPAGIRFKWMKELLKDYKNIELVHIKGDLPRNRRPTRAGSYIWADYCVKRFGKIDKIFSSEKYGEYMAKRMDAENCVFDFKREKNPVSGTMIRKSPKRYWGFIPEVVKPYFDDRFVGAH